MLKKNPKESALMLICVFVFLLMGVLSGGRFWSLSSLSSMMSILPEFGILAFAMMFILLTGGINLSLTYISTLSGIVMVSVMAKVHESGATPAVSILAGIAVGLVVALACGLINGFLVAYLHVSPMLATLGTNLLFKGIGMNMSGATAVTGFPQQYSAINNMLGKYIPYTFIAFVLLVFFIWIMLERRAWGAKLHMAGSNEIAMNYSGVNVSKLLLQVYIASAALCFLSAIIMAARYNSMKVDYGFSYLMESILACVLGGVSINGGYGKVAGMVLSMLTIRFIASGLTVVGVRQAFVDMFMGLLLISVLMVNYLISLNRKKKRRALSK